MQIANSDIDIRRASERLTRKEIEKFARNVSISELCSPTTPVTPTGVWYHCRISDRATAYRNVLGVSLSFFACFSAFIAEVSLQSSLNSDEGLGLASLIVINVGTSVGVFFSPSVLSILGTKYSIICGYVGFLIFTLSNYYPSWFTLMPGTVIVGVALGAVIWTGVYSHVNSVAVKSALSLKEDPKHLIAFFSGVFTFFYKSSYFPGNTVSSIVLFTNRQENISIVGDNGTCNNTEAANLDEIYVYIMLSVFVVFDVVGIAIVTLCVDDLGTNRKFVSAKQFFKHHLVEPVKAMVNILISWNMILLAPMILLDVFTISAMVALFSKAYVSDCIGVRWVGLVLMTHGVSSGISGFVSGRLVKHVPQYLITYSVLTVYLAVLLFLLFWEPAPLHYVLFIVSGLFGVCEGSFSCITASLTGIMFPDQQEAAFSVNRFWFGLGSAIAFLYTLVVSVRVQLWLMVAQLVISVLTYSILIFKTLSRDQLLPCLPHKSLTPSVNSEDA